MSFRITPQDVGRRAILRNGRIVKILGRDGNEVYPYEVVDGLSGNHVAVVDCGGHFFADDKSPHKYDVMSWADEFARKSEGE